jgi:hypothetical protein
MALKRSSWPPGRVVTVEHVSRVLADNPLGDPHVRTLDVWLPPQYDQARGRGRGARFPVLFDLVGYTGSGKSHTNWRSFEENVPERAARLVHERKMGPVIIVFPDCFTALGGNQYVNSTAIGAYADYLTRELIRSSTRKARTPRASIARFPASRGGYGAIIHGMKYTRYWGAVANHSGDAYFDFVYGADWPNTLDELAKFRRPPRVAGKIDVGELSAETGRGLDDGRVKRFLESVWKKTQLGSADVHCLMNPRWPRVTTRSRTRRTASPARPGDGEFCPELPTMRATIPSTWSSATPTICASSRASTWTAAGAISTASTMAAGCCRSAWPSTASRTATRNSTTRIRGSTIGWN